MRDSGNRRASMVAALSLAMLAAEGPGLAQAGPTLRTAGDGNNRRPTLPRRDTALSREIADWNEAVQAKKDAKRLAKMRRR